MGLTCSQGEFGFEGQAVRIQVSNGRDCVPLRGGDRRAGR